MAIMEVDETVSRTGFRKKIDEESEDVILNMVQVGIYQFPFKSMVRETVSNAVDAVKEKQTARLILTGAAQVSDFYIEMEGDRYKNSKFDPDYYDLSWLSPNDTVYIEYRVNDDIAGRDTLSIKDFGVGLGKTRLEKFFLPGASSKRLNKQALGKFGIGNKSPLATGAGSYRMISTYNGHKYIFDIRESKVDPVVPRFDETGAENPHILLEGTLDMRGNPMKVYYLPTKEKNSVEIQVEIKKHNKDQVYEAVKSQLMYFKEDIQFVEVATGSERTVEFKTPILFEDEDLILPVHTGFYAKPHFVLNGVCYGLIDFKEMELNPRFGAIGIKVDISSIDVTPSRESVVYSQKTKDTILNQYEKIAKKVEHLVKEELKVTDPIQWMQAANGVLSGNGGATSVVSRLAGLIDKEEIALTHSNPIQDFTLTPSLSKTFGKNLKFYNLVSSGWGSDAKIKLESVDNTGSVNFEHSYHKTEKGDAIKNSYIHHKNNSVATSSIYSLEWPNEETKTIGERYIITPNLDDAALTTALSNAILSTYVESKARDAAVAELIKSIKSLMVIKSSKSYQTYEDVQVPQKFIDDYKAGKAAAAIIQTEQESASDRLAKRKAAGKVVLGVLTSKGGYSTVFSSKEFQLDSLPETIVYGHNADSENLTTMGIMLHNHYNLRNDRTIPADTVLSTHPDIAIFKAAQALRPKLKEQTHIEDWGFSVQDGKLVLEDAIMPSVYNVYILKYSKAKFGKAISLDTMAATAAMLNRIDSTYFKTMSKIFKGKYVRFIENSTTFVRNLAMICVDQILLERTSNLDDDLKLEEFTNRFPKTNKIDASDITNYQILDQEDLKVLEELVELTFHYYPKFSDVFNNVGLMQDWSLLPRTASLAKEYVPMILEHYRSKLSEEYPNLF